MSLLERKLQRDVGRRRAQFAAILITIIIGVALFGASFDAFQNLLASYQALFDRTSFAALTIEGGDRVAVAAAVRDQPGVAAVATRSTTELPLRINTHDLIGRLVGLPPSGQPAVDRVLVLSGANLDPADPTGVLVDRHVADNFGLRPGDSLEVHGPAGWQTLRIRGVVSSPEYIWPARSRQEVLTLPDQFGVVFVPQPLLDALPASLVTPQVLVTYSGSADDPGLTASLVERARAAGATDAFTQAEQPSNAALHEDISGFGELSVMFPVMFLTAAGLAAYVLLGRMVLAQRSQIGLLLAEGFGRRRIFGHYLGFGLATGLVGAIVGALLGVLLAGLITEVYTGVIAIPITIIEVRPLTAALGILFGVVAGGLAAFAPARRAARLSPAAAMSGQVASGRGGASRLERAVPPLRRLPARWKMVVRGMGRSPLRSASTIGGVAIAVTLVFVSWGMLDTIQLLLDRQFNQAVASDAVVYLPGGASRASLAAIRDVDGVAAAEPLAQLPVTIDHAGSRYTTTLAALPVDTTMHRFLGETGQLGLPDDGILVGRALRGTLGLAVGDEVTVLLGQGLTAQARVSGFVDEPLGTYAYASLTELAAMVGPDRAASETLAANVRFLPGADPAAVDARLRGLDGVAAVLDTRALQRLADQFMGLFYAFVGAMLVLGAIMAFALLFNLMSANIGERVTELASLRASGLSGGELSRIITGENVILTLAGIVPGLVVGYLVAVEFMASFSSDLFSFDLEVRPTTFLFSALGVLVAALVSQAPILRAVRRIDIAQVVRERAL